MSTLKQIRKSRRIKAVNMAKLMNIPILGIVENMSYFKCDNCDKKHYIFGESKIDDIASGYGISTVAKIPIDPEIPSIADKGLIELFEGDWLLPIAKKIEE